MTSDKKSVFSRQSILDKQKEAQEEYEKKVVELRQAFQGVADTPNGEKVLKYLFLLCGGDSSSVRRDKESKVSVEDTLIVLGAKGVYEAIRFNLSSDTIKKIERHDWEK